MNRPLPALLVLVACGSGEPDPISPQPWRTTARVAAASEIVSDDATRRGEAKPQAIAFTGETVVVAHTNLRRNPANGSYAPAGPSVLEFLDPATLARVALLPLVRDSQSCRNAGALASAGGKLFVACAGTITDDGSIAIVDLATRALDRVVDTGLAPGSLAVAQGRVWAGDLAGGRLVAITTTGEVLRGRGGQPPIELCPARNASDFPMVGGVQITGAIGWATCFSHDELRRFDPESGADVGAPLATGDGPLALAGDGDTTYVLDNLGSTLTRARDARTDAAILALGQVPQELAARDGLLAITNSGDGTVTFVTSTLAKVASVDLKREGAGTPYPWGVTFGRSAREAFVALNGTSEIVRLERSDP